MDTGSRLSIAAIIILLGFAMYFAIAETAFATVSRIRLKTRLDKGDHRAKGALLVLDNFDKAITTVLIGTNIVHITVAAIVTVLVTRKWGISAVTAGTLVTTAVVFFGGEMLPKSIAKKYSERLCLQTAGSLRFFMALFSPLSAALTAIGHAVSNLTRGDPEVSVTEDELYDIIEDMTDEGTLEPERGELMSSALQFADLSVETVLTARVDVAAINSEWDSERVLAFIKEQRHSRLPVYEGSIDNIVGVLQIRKYIRAYLKEGPSVSLSALLDEAYFVPRSMKIDELLSVMRRQPKVLRYLDVPLQHCSGRVLRAMNRPGDRESLTALFGRIREALPGVVLRTTILVGFPGETEADFEELCAFIKELRFERLGCFAFSSEEGTPAASMPGQIPETVKSRRRDIVMQTQERIADAYNQAQLGKTLDVLVESFDRYAECWFGRSAADAPDIDGKVFFTTKTRVAPGDLIRVRITDCLDWDLLGERV